MLFCSLFISTYIFIFVVFLLVLPPSSSIDRPSLFSSPYLSLVSLPPQPSPSSPPSPLQRWRRRRRPLRPPPCYRFSSFSPPATPSPALSLTRRTPLQHAHRPPRQAAALGQFWLHCLSKWCRAATAGRQTARSSSRPTARGLTRPSACLAGTIVPTPVRYLLPAHTLVLTALIFSQMDARLCVHAGEC